MHIGLLMRPTYAGGNDVDVNRFTGYVFLTLPFNHRDYAVGCYGHSESFSNLLMSAIRYVLGKQIEEKLAPAETELIYESSNGDSWCLTRDPATGARAVMHRPNPQSGGKVSYIEIEKFLSEGANGPEHQAVRRLLETNARMATILIAYDIHPRKVKHMTILSKRYDRLAPGGIISNQPG
jgi:hypothetical protein